MDIKIYADGTVSSLEAREEEQFEMDSKFAQVAYFESDEIYQLARRALNRVRRANKLLSDPPYDKLDAIYRDDYLMSVEDQRNNDSD